jgi:C-terminal processing protease CtpA/Prc
LSISNFLVISFLLTNYFFAQVDIEDDGANGLVVRSVAPGGTFARDGRILPGDYLVRVNGENMRNISHSQVRPESAY